MSYASGATGFANQSMDTEGMVEVRDLTKIRLVMVMLEVVQIAILVGKSYRMRLWAVSRLFP